MSLSLSLSDASGRLLAAGTESSLQSGEAERVRRFSGFWRESQPSVRAYLASFVPDGGVLDDCVQEVALVAWRKGPLDDGSDPFLHHALACARHIGMAARRKIRGERLKLLSPDVAEALADAVAARECPAAAEATDRVEALRRCIGRLSEDQQALVRMRYAGEGVQEVTAEARRTGKSPDALYKRLERLRALLRECVTRQLATLE